MITLHMHSKITLYLGFIISLVFPFVYFRAINHNFNLRLGTIIHINKYFAESESVISAPCDLFGEYDFHFSRHPQTENVLLLTLAIISCSFVYCCGSLFDFL